MTPLQKVQFNNKKYYTVQVYYRPELFESELRATIHYPHTGDGCRRACEAHIEWRTKLNGNYAITGNWHMAKTIRGSGEEELEFSGTLYY